MSPVSVDHTITIAMSVKDRHKRDMVRNHVGI